MSTLGIDIATAAHNVYEISGKGNYEVNTGAQCQAGFSIAQQEDNSTIDTPVLANTGSDEQSGKLIVSNCSTSLQLISTSLTIPDNSVYTSAANNSVILPASKLFVRAIADPPQPA